MSTRTGREPLSAARLLGAAVELADTEGIAAVTMRRLAGVLGVEAMSLYHHVPGKEALLDGLVDAVVEEVTTAIRKLDEHTVKADWQSTLRRRFLAARTVMFRHPWAPGLIGTRASIPPSVFGHYEALLAALVEAGFSYHLAHRALHTFGSMPLGFVQELFSPATSGGSTDVELTEAELAQMAEALPHITAMVASEIHENDDEVLGWCDSQAEFEFTIDLLLDGFAHLLEAGR